MYFQLIAVIVGALATPKTLEEVYGPLEPVSSMSAPWKNNKDRSTRSDNFHAQRTNGRCDFPIDVLLIQDATASFDDNFDQMINVQLPSMVTELSKDHPSSRFAVMSFRDKPIVPFGVPETDYCQEISLDFTTNATILTNYYAGLSRVGGGDPAENQFGALLAAGQTFKLSWSLNVDSANLIVMITDAPPHFEGDGNDVQNMSPSTGLFIDEMAESLCTSQYYPNPDQVMFSVLAAEAYLASVVYDPEYWNGLPGSSWKWFNRFLGQTDDFVNIGAQDHSDFWAKLSRVITAIEEIECGPKVPTESPATTVTPAVETPTPTTTTELSTTLATTTAAPATVTPVGTVQPPLQSDECEVNRFCDDGVELKFVRRPENLEVVIDGKHVDI